MFERNLILKHIAVKDSFLYVNTNLKFLKIGTCVRLIDSENHAFYFSIGNCSTELEDNYIGISSLMAKTLGIENNVLFRVSEMTPYPSVESLTIFPVNRTEYEVMEMLSNNIQETLLNQIRVVYSGQKFIIWIGNNISVCVCVGNIYPVSPGAVDFLTEVHIEPVLDKILPKDTLSNDTPEESFNFKSWNFFDSGFENKDNNHLQKYIKTASELIYRIVPLKKIPNIETFLKSIHPFKVFLSKEQFSNDYLEKHFFTKIFSLSLVTNDLFAKDTYVKLEFLEDFQVFDCDLHQNLYVGEEIFDFFDCQLGARVILKPVDKYPIVNEIQINSKKNYLTDVLETFKYYLAKGSDDTFVLNSGLAIEIGEKIVCSLNFFPDEPRYCVVDDNLVRNCKYVLNTENIVKDSKQSEKTKDGPFLKDISNYKNLMKEVLTSFSMPDKDMEHVLIEGKPGTGKSTTIKQIVKHLQNYPYFVYVKHVNCKTIKGKTMDSVGKFFSTAFSELLLHQPSVLVLDDLHILCENVQGDEVAPNNIYFCRISEMLHNFLKMFSPLNKIGILSTTQSIQKLNKNIYSSRGSHLFKNVYSIEDLTKGDRIKALKFLLKDFKLDDINFNELSVKTEGFVIQDLVDFTNKTIFEIFKHEPDEKKQKLIKPEYLDRSLKNTSVIALQNVQLHSPGDKDFSNIGGLHRIKKVLVENLLWPGLYPNIFANAPLRLQSGLLLYGPPGSGKTVLAAAAAKECGLRLISVKGPELLSKYIGASEQAVRDIFQKAQSARPCILFFDEFDSLAPKRGHDNTGVTDRVVNQFLTQLDGVESLTGVCILAATSRPDLLDSALLRPGRLDKQILCPLPDEAERLEILEIFSKNLSLENNVALEKIAAVTENYSGADLQSLLYTAHMMTIDYSFENEKISTQDCKITRNDLEEALRKTKPSLSSNERLKYDMIYAKFKTGHSLENFKAGSRATLA